jgi:hypothetical protein
MFKSGTLLILGIIAAGIVYQILERVPQDALTVALGVACGVGASIPVSVGLFIALMRNKNQAESYEMTSERAPVPVEQLPQQMPQRVVPAQQQPQIIVIAPPQGQFNAGQFPPGFLNAIPWLGSQSGATPEGDESLDARDWRIIGE